jgi:endothelin-converting enzyme
LTNLEKLLAGAAVLLLITTGTFVGLFAGTEVALKKERAGHGGDGGEDKWHTVTATATRTSTAPGSTVTVVPSGKPSKVSLEYR